MARRNTPSRTSKRQGRNTSKSYAGAWIFGGFVAVALVCVLLFSRNEDKYRQASKPARREAPRIVKMRQDGGVYYIPARINGQELEFIFDTGASAVLISQVEATLLWKQGRLSEEDILGEVQSSIADGSVVNNTAIILRTVEVAGVTLYDVEALVSANVQAPLLLGQSVMSKFGSFTMDYERSTITFR